MRSGLIDRHPNFIKSRDLQDPHASVVMNVVIIEGGDDLAKDNDVMESDTVPSEIVTVDRYFLVWC